MFIENRTEHKNTLRRQNEDFDNVKEDVTYTYQCGVNS
jgi:hypothetical protein